MRDTTIDPVTVSRDLSFEESAAQVFLLEVDEGDWPDRVTAQQVPRPSARSGPSSSRVVERMDRGVARVLRVQLQPVVPQDAVTTPTSRPFETSLLISAVRCTLLYIVLPFVLPLMGVITGATLGLLLILDAIAAIAIVATLRRLWRLQHPRRWQYLSVVLALVVLVAFFFVNDTRVLYA